MQYYFWEKNPLRLLDEAQFWKRQEKEHTAVVRNSTPDLEPKYINELENFDLAFTQMEGKAVQLIETTIRSKENLSPSLKKEISMFIEASIAQSQQFIDLLDSMLANSKAVKSNQFSQIVIDHIRRESEYFIGIAQTIMYG
jgi:hypothetical protein